MTVTWPQDGDLSQLAVEELKELQDSLIEEFKTLYDKGDDVSEDEFTRMQEITEQVTATREQVKAVEADTAQKAAKRAELAEAIAPEADDKDDAADTAPVEDAADTQAQEPELVAAQSNSDLSDKNLATVVASAVGETIQRLGLADPADYLKSGNRMNDRLRLGQIAAYAPNAQAPVPRDEAVLVASTDVPGYTKGGQLEDLEELGKAMHARARSLPVSRTGNPEPALVASLQREFSFQLDIKSNPTEVNAVLKAATDPEILTAAGGWCAPEEISYDFYNIVCLDGLIDLPTVGVQRGGFRHPISPSFADAAGADDIVWTWTEQDDIDALDPEDGPVKPCVRVPCPEFTSVRPDCDGFCVTAGNLVAYAYPELIANWLRLVMNIRARVTNARIIDLLINGGGSGDGITPSTPVDHTGFIGSTTTKLLSSLELSAVDYRARHGMCVGDIMEVKLPQWALSVVRTDIAHRDGLDTLAVTNEMIADWFTRRNIAVQFVGDWQVRGPGLPGAVTPATEWPDTIDYLIYPPGTFVRGNGMSLDLGVVRDSVLNATNDHTAAWAEDCYMVTKPGHESRIVTVDICNSGVIGARSLECLELS